MLNMKKYLKDIIIRLLAILSEKCTGLQCKYYG